MSQLEPPSVVVEPGASVAAELERRVGARRLPGQLRRWAVRAIELVLLLLAISTLLFFLLHLTGDPATAIAGADASEQQIAAVRAQYGLDDGIFEQYLTFLGKTLTLDFGRSFVSGQPALEAALDRVPSTLLLAGGALLIDLVVAVTVGTFIGSNPHRWSRKLTSAGLSIMQGIPGYVMGLLLIQVFTVELGLLPSIGDDSFRHWILPSLTLAAFYYPKLAKVVSVGTGAAMREDYVRTARATGASRLGVVLREALPNAVLSITALLGAQFSYMLSAAVITEFLFAWPGLGSLVVEAVQRRDFPIVQATVFVVATLVFLANAATEAVFVAADPRIRRRV